MRRLASLIIVAGVCGALVGGVHLWTDPHITANEAAVRLAQYRDVTGLSAVPQDIDRNSHALCPALRVERVATPGYGGELEALIALDSSGSLTGLRIVRHSETPGIGDFIDANQSDWPDRQRGLAVGQAADLDAVSGATVTVRAVANALNAAWSRPPCP